MMDTESYAIFANATLICLSNGRVRKTVTVSRSTFSFLQLNKQNENQILNQSNESEFVFEIVGIVYN